MNRMVYKTCSKAKPDKNEEHDESEKKKTAAATTTDLPKIKTVGVNYVIQIYNNGCECMSCG